MSDKQSVSDKGPINKYFSMMLHIDDDDLDPFEYRLLGHYRKFCGLHGHDCNESILQTAKAAQMNIKTAREARNHLVEKRRITLVPTRNNIVAVVLLDCMQENLERYASPIKNGRALDASPTENDRAALSKTVGLGSSEGAPAQAEQASLRNKEDQEKTLNSFEAKASHELAENASTRLSADTALNAQEREIMRQLADGISSARYFEAKALQHLIELGIVERCGDLDTIALKGKCPQKLQPVTDSKTLLDHVIHADEKGDPVKQLNAELAKEFAPLSKSENPLAPNSARPLPPHITPVRDDDIEIDGGPAINMPVPTRSITLELTYTDPLPTAPAPQSLQNMPQLPAVKPGDLVWWVPPENQRNLCGTQPRVAAVVMSISQSRVHIVTEKDGVPHVKPENLHLREVNSADSRSFDDPSPLRDWEKAALRIVQTAAPASLPEAPEGYHVVFSDCRHYVSEGGKITLCRQHLIQRRHGREYRPFKEAWHYAHQPTQCPDCAAKAAATPRKAKAVKPAKAALKQPSAEIKNALALLMFGGLDLVNGSWALIIKAWNAVDCPDLVKVQRFAEWWPKNWPGNTGEKPGIGHIKAHWDKAQHAEMTNEPVYDKSLDDDIDFPEVHLADPV